MQSTLYKCCFCLNIIKCPMVMCQQTHIGCFNCVCMHIEKSPAENCPLCRQSLSLRMDRLITETCATFRSAKRRKIDSNRYDVFLKLLSLRDKDKHRNFTRTLIRFIKATPNESELERVSSDIDNICRAKESSQHLRDLRLLNRFSPHV